MHSEKGSIACLPLQVQSSTVASAKIDTIVLFLFQNTLLLQTL